ncbi:hypothetical protein [Natronorubrum sp. A-ect3]|uniref:hypothetical protein n=1 Tax=Natronorubrum sp. A-ect3 TaxID=3242698 RepID=UPI00359EFAC0
MHRRQFLRISKACAVGSVLGCFATAPLPEAPVDEQIYTCSYDAEVFALGESSDPYQTVWNESRSDQTTDIQLDRNHDVLICNRGDGLEKWSHGASRPQLRWRYDGLSSSIRGISVDKHNDYYLGSWNEHGFHKIVEVDNEPRRAWEYTWSGDDGMIVSAPRRTGEVAVGLKNNEVHLISEREGEPHRHWCWTPKTGEIIRELLWGPDDELYIGCEDHVLYKLIDTGPKATPSVEWTYDSENIIFGASRTPDGDIYIATNAGEVHYIRDEDGTPKRQWVYHHTTPDDPVPTDDYWWDGLVHQVAVRRDNSELYSCSYDGTVHRIVEEDGQPVTDWEFDAHTDNVREVRIQYEALGTWPEKW